VRDGDLGNLPDRPSAWTGDHRAAGTVKRPLGGCKRLGREWHPGDDRSGEANGLTRETVQVQVYHRKDSHETKGWYVVSPPRDEAAQFDGRRLMVAGLTATFDPDTVRWTGEWVLDGDRRQVVFQMSLTNPT
jgi:hypothetical protein